MYTYRERQRAKETETKRKREQDLCLRMCACMYAFMYVCMNVCMQMYNIYKCTKRARERDLRYYAPIGIYPTIVGISTQSIPERGQPGTSI